MPCIDPENTPLPGDLENVLLRKLLNRLCNISSGGGGGGVSQAYVDARDAATLASANSFSSAGDAATLAAALASASSLYVLKSGDTMTGALLLPSGAVATPSLSHAADANTGLWFPAADTIALSTAGVERMRISSAGFVGVGVTPATPLHVGSSQNGASAFVGYIYNSDPTNGAGLLVDAGVGASDQVFRLRNRAASTEILTALASGNVGIGITAPLAKLHVTPAASGTDYFRIDHSDGTPRFQFGVYPGSATYGALWLGSITPSSDNYAMIGLSGQTYLNAAAGGNLYFAIGEVNRWNINPSGHFLASTDNTYDIGASGATRPRNGYFAGGIIVGSVAALITSSAAMNDGAAAALGTLTNAPVAGNPTKWIPIDDNGTTRYFPAW